MFLRHRDRYRSHANQHRLHPSAFWYRSSVAPDTLGAELRGDGRFGCVATNLKGESLVGIAPSGVKPEHWPAMGDVLEVNGENFTVLHVDCDNPAGRFTLPAAMLALAAGGFEMLAMGPMDAEVNGHASRALAAAITLLVGAGITDGFQFSRRSRSSAGGVAPRDHVPILRSGGRMQRVLLALVRLYQRVFRPILPPMCRFFPSCSDYAIEALQLHGAVHGGALTVKRLCRCHPFNPGGVDPVPTTAPPTHNGQGEP